MKNAATTTMSNRTQFLKKYWPAMLVTILLLSVIFKKQEFGLTIMLGSYIAIAWFSCKVMR